MLIESSSPARLDHLRAHSVDMPRARQALQLTLSQTSASNAELS